VEDLLPWVAWEARSSRTDSSSWSGRRRRAKGGLTRERSSRREKHSATISTVRGRVEAGVTVAEEGGRKHGS
jgi:hypothetical protein